MKIGVGFVLKKSYLSKVSFFVFPKEGFSFKSGVVLFCFSHKKLYFVLFHASFCLQRLCFCFLSLVLIFPSVFFMLFRFCLHAVLFKFFARFLLQCFFETKVFFLLQGVFVILQVFFFGKGLNTLATGVFFLTEAFFLAQGCYVLFATECCFFNVLAMFFFARSLRFFFLLQVFFFALDSVFFFASGSVFVAKGFVFLFAFGFVLFLYELGFVSFFFY